ncbi:hypothetical protein D3C72_848630 [compost metagenome]
MLGLRHSALTAQLLPAHDKKYRQHHQHQHDAGGNGYNTVNTPFLFQAADGCVFLLYLIHRLEERHLPAVLYTVYLQQYTPCDLGIVKGAVILPHKVISTGQVPIG